MLPKEIYQAMNTVLEYINSLGFNDKVDAINEIRYSIYQISPFKNEPVDYIEWVPKEEIIANDYNPNKVAPPEMELLKRSIEHDGYTQPIVSWHEKNESMREVIDGFHRTKVCDTFIDISNRVFGHLPIVTIKNDCVGRNNRIASTIRHNRARGKHTVDGMSDIVIELKKRNWTDSRIGKELGMDPDEVLRLCQVSGLIDVFSDTDFSEAWDAEIFTNDDFQLLNEEVDI